MNFGPKLPGQGHRSRNKLCITCGAPVPRNRTDKRFCCWRHDPDLLDPAERDELAARYPAPALINDAS